MDSLKSMMKSVGRVDKMIFFYLMLTERKDFHEYYNSIFVTMCLYGMSLFLIIGIFLLIFVFHSRLRGIKMIMFFLRVFLYFGR